MFCSLFFATAFCLNIITCPIKYEITGYCLKGKMANGLIVHSGATACPANLHLGTKIGILGDGFINNSFTCEDRMALKYRHGNYIDIWFSDCDIAIEFGRQKRFVKINN